MEENWEAVLSYWKGGIKRTPPINVPDVVEKGHLVVMVVLLHRLGEMSLCLLPDGSLLLLAQKQYVIKTAHGRIKKKGMKLCPEMGSDEVSGGQEWAPSSLLGQLDVASSEYS